MRLLLAMTGGYHLAYLAGAGLVALALVAAITVLRPAPTPPEQAAQEAWDPSTETPVAQAA